MPRCVNTATNMTPTPTTPTPRRRWLQFSLRAMLVLMLVVSVPLGWFAFKLRQARQQRQVIEAIKKLGGGVDYYGPASSGMIRSSVAWLGEFLGEDLSKDVLSVNLCNTTVTDAGLEHLRGLTQLQVLYLRVTPVTGAGVAELQKALPKCGIKR